MPGALRPSMNTSLSRSRMRLRRPSVRRPRTVANHRSPFLLCGECNSLLGTTLVPEYAQWAGPVRDGLVRAKQLVDWADRIPEQSQVKVGWAGRPSGGVRLAGPGDVRDW